MKIQPAWWLKVFAQTQDARVLYKSGTPAPPYQDTWDLRLALPRSATRRTAFSPSRRAAGDQSWRRAAGGKLALDQRRAQLRCGAAALHHKKLRLDVFAASVVVLRWTGRRRHAGKQSLRPLRGFGKRDSQTPPSSLTTLAVAVRCKSATGRHRHIRHEGFRRALGRHPARGTSITTPILPSSAAALLRDTIDAWAGHWVIGFKVPALALVATRLFVEYNYATGSASAKLGQRNTFDQLYPTAHDKYGSLRSSGLEKYPPRPRRSGVEVRSRWSMSARYSDYWLANAHDALYNTSNARRRANGRRVGRTMGGPGSRFRESDARCRRSRTIGAGFSHIFPGTFLKMATPGQNYTAPYLFFETKF